MTFKPHYAMYCKNCGLNHQLLAIRSDVINKEDFNYCPICGNELGSSEKGDML